MGGSQANGTPRQIRPLEEGYRAPRRSILVGVEQMPMQNIILVHCQLYSPKTENFSVESTVDLLVRGYKGDMVKALNQTFKL
jgi:hypothetical protein